MGRTEMVPSVIMGLGGFFTSGSGNWSGLGFQQGLTGGDGGTDGGFGGGGGGDGGSSDRGGGGGGYSGGGGSNGERGGGGGSYVNSYLSSTAANAGVSNGLVFIKLGASQNLVRSGWLLDDSWKPSGICTLALIDTLGSNYRFATSAEVTKAREAATPGGVNDWTASNQVKPRNLPGKVNEYGFDVSTTSGLWIIKE